MRINFISIIMTMSIVLGLLPTMPLNSIFANDEDNVVDATLDVWEDWGNAQLVSENDNHVIRLGNDGGLGNIYHEEYEGPRTLIFSARARVGSEDDEPAIIGLNVFDADYVLVDKHELEIHSVGEYENGKLEIVLPEGVLQLQAYVYKNPGTSYAYIDDVRLSDADETVELIANGGFEEFEVNEPEPTETTAPSEPTVPTEPSEGPTIVDATLDVWEVRGDVQLVSEENDNHVIRLGDGAITSNYFHEEYDGPRTLILSARARVGAEDDTPAIIGLEYYDADYEWAGEFVFEIHSVDQYEYGELEIVLPDNAAHIAVYLNKSDGSSYAYIDDVRLTDADETVELVENGGFEEFTMNEPEPTDPEEPEEPVEPVDPVIPDVYSGKNIVLNPDFEAEFNNNEDGEAADITNWPNDLDLDSGNIGQTFITTEGKDSGQSMVTGPGEGGRSQFIYGIPENTEFVLSGSGRVSHEGEVGYLGVDYLDANRNKIGKRGVEFRGVDWADLSLEFTTVPGTVGIQVYTYKNASPEGLESYAYFDDVSVVISPDHVIREELLINPGFENETEGWEDWGNFNIIEDPVDGEFSAQVLDEGGFAQYVELEPGQTYELRFWGKVDPGHVVYWGIQEPGRIRFATGEIATTDYTEVVARFTAPDVLDNPHVYVWNDPGGNAYFDSFSLKVAGAETPEDNPEFVTPYHREGVFFDDFDNGIDEEYWLIGKSQWGGPAANNGVIPENISVENGVVTITARGNNYEGELTGYTRTENGIVPSNSGKRTGGALITKDHYASGSYEMRAKLIDELGVVSAMWTYFNNDVSNHEIDFPETPGVGADGRPNPNQVMANNWITEAQNDSFVVDTPTVLGNEQGVLDGEWHTFRFDWHTDTANPRVEYYLDDILVHTSYDFVPTAAGNLWIGAWFPENWAGVADFAEATMEIDWVRITPFYEDGDEWLRGWGLDVADLTEYPDSTLPEYERFNTDNFIYTHLAEMNERLAFTNETMRDLLDEMTYFGINMQFLDMGMYDSNGLLPQSELDDELTRRWMAMSREYKPDHQIMATVNGNLDEHLRHSEEMRQAMADEAARLVEVYGFDGVQVDIEPFRADSNDLMVDYLEKLREAVRPDVHISIATTVLAQYLPHEALVEIANIVDMINPMLYDTNGPGENEVNTDEGFVQIWKETVLRYDAAIKASNNPDVQLAPTMPAYDAKSYPASPGWPDPASGRFYYHLPEIEHIENAAEGLRQAIEAGADVYGSGLFWWGTFTRVTYDQRDGQDYAKDRDWWINEWVGYQLSEIEEPVELEDVVLISGAGQTIDGTTDLEFVTSADFSSFIGVTLNGEELASENYAVSEGSTVVVIGVDFLSTLEDGSHTLIISNAETETHRAADLEVSFELASEPEETTTEATTEATTDTTTEVEVTTEVTTAVEETTAATTVIGTTTAGAIDPSATTAPSQTDGENITQTGESTNGYIAIISIMILVAAMIIIRRKVKE